jgi:hypothetical protein
MLTLYINLPGSAHFVHDLPEGTARLVFAIASGLSHVKVFHHFFVVLDWDYHGGLVALSVYHELNIL